MKIRRLASLVLAGALTLVCLSGCGEKERTDLNACWGMTLAEAAESYGVSAEDGVVQQSSGLSGDSIYAEFEKAEVLGVPCALKMSFTGYADNEPLLAEVNFCFDNRRDFDRLYEKLTALDSYTEIGDSEGFYDVSALSKEDIAWLEQYTAVGAGEKGIAFAELSPKDGVLYKTGSYGEETVPVQMYRSSHEEDSVYFIRLVDCVFHALAQKDALEQIHPDGIPTLEE